MVTRVTITDGTYTTATTATPDNADTFLFLDASDGQIKKNTLNNLPGGGGGGGGISEELAIAYAVAL